ncbi:MAG: 4'-phosphopantetheinyl transferase superfamily protein [Muribaculaceae bacterium]|nr:4'-phosphopantetheinyl transferase superfamily protein [Muribaculaceae bacterium]
MIYIHDDLGSISKEEFEEMMAEMAESRRQKCLALRQETDRLQCAIAHRLLLKALREEFGIRDIPVWSFNPNGKPYLRDYPQIHFSLSHCKEAVACAVADHPVGIDVESLQAYDSSLARYVCSDGEYEQLKSKEDAATAFCVLWTKKESLLKLRGESFPSREQLSDLLENCNNKFHTLIHSRYVLSLCEE